MPLLNTQDEDFNPRSPGGERLAGQRLRQTRVQISIHAPRVGSVRAFLFRRHIPRNFNPRSPGGERRQLRLILLAASGDFNPRSPGGERRLRPDLCLRGLHISIHAPRVGSVSKKAQICFLVLFFITRLFYFYGTSGMPAPAFLYKIHFV